MGKPVIYTYMCSPGLEHVRWPWKPAVRVLYNQFVTGSELRLLSHSAGDDKLHPTLSPQAFRIPGKAVGYGQER